MSMAMIIAIDGPASAGKSTLGRLLAEYLDYLYFDSGLMYRAVTWAAIDRAVPLQDENAIVKLAEALQIDVRQPSVDDGREIDVVVGGADVTWDVRKPEVDAYVSIVSAYPGVRKALTAQQRGIGLRGKVVMVGRDIGTVVLPEADLKIYLDASVEERARRRLLERLGRQEEASLDEILESMRQRDEMDSSRSVAPLKPAEDAAVLFSEDMDANQVLEKVKTLLAKDNEQH